MPTASDCKVMTCLASRKLITLTESSCFSWKKFFLSRLFHNTFLAVLCRISFFPFSSFFTMSTKKMNWLTEYQQSKVVEKQDTNLDDPQ